MSPQEPAWNAAISFVYADRIHAEQIASHFDDRARIFVYSRRLEETTGTNGVDKFSQIFGRDARLIVVLYRPTWGETGFTKIEKEAIDSRRVDERRSDFLLVVFMQPGERPSWLPAARIYGDWSELGPKGVADAIRKRLGELGRSLPAESVADRARRMREQREWELKRCELLYGYAGRHAFDQESAKVFDALKAHAGEIDATFEVNGRCAYVVHERGIYSTVAMTSDGRDSELLAQVWDGEFWGVGTQPVGTVKRKVCLTFELQAPDTFGWRDGNRFYTSDDAADEDDRRERERLRRR